MSWPCSERLPSFFSLSLSSSSSSPDDYVVRERAQCLGCPQEVPDNSEDLRGPLTASIHKYNSMSDSTHLFAFNNVQHATRQVGAGWHEERGSGRSVRWRKTCFFSTYLLACVPVGGRRFQVQAEIWHEEDQLRQGRTQRSQPPVCPWWGECGKHGNKTHPTTDLRWRFTGLTCRSVCIDVCRSLPTVTRQWI